MKKESYDLIGDIHGHADALHALLEQLGYEYDASCYRHPERRVIFLGDYIDRGPAIRETLAIVRGMVEAGAAIALCGNHEWNALLHETPDGRGGWLIPHGGRQTKYMTRTLEEFAGDAPAWRETLGWFRALPLYLSLPGLRAVHACWDDGAIAEVERHGPRDERWLRRAADRESALGRAVRALLKGREIPLPPGMTLRGTGDARFDEVRVRWWLDGRGRTYREACIHRHEAPPAIPIPPEHEPLVTPPFEGDARPIFFGHYWMAPGRPAPLTPKLACLDYSAGIGAPLVAYRRDGEAILLAEKFVAAGGTPMKAEDETFEVMVD